MSDFLLNLGRHLHRCWHVSPLVFPFFAALTCAVFAVPSFGAAQRTPLQVYRQA
jgi:hypothetical protein